MENELKKPKDKYTLSKFPFRAGMEFVKVEEIASGKHCKFLVKTDANGYTLELRSPTPGFPGKDEMTTEEITPRLAEMQAVIMDKY